MENKRHTRILQDAPFACAWHQMIFDENGTASDYVFLEVNKTFEKLTGLKSGNIIQKRVTEVISEIKSNDFNWIGFYGDVVKNDESKKFERYCHILKKWYR
ncbi:MAG: hypothetical protein ACOC4J_04120 [Bacteroidota bacterium]